MLKQKPIIDKYKEKAKINASDYLLNELNSKHIQWPESLNDPLNALVDRFWDNIKNRKYSIEDKKYVLFIFPETKTFDTKLQDINALSSNKLNNFDLILNIYNLVKETYNEYGDDFEIYATNKKENAFFESVSEIVDKL